MKKYWIFALSLLFVGCASRVNNFHERMDTWIGHSRAEVIDGWGKPSSVLDDGEGGEILVYRYTRRVYTGTPLYGGGLILIKKIRRFYVNGDGIVYTWSYKG